MSDIQVAPQERGTYALPKTEAPSTVAKLDGALSELSAQVSELEKRIDFALDQRDYPEEEIGTEVECPLDTRVVDLHREIRRLARITARVRL